MKVPTPPENQNTTQVSQTPADLCPNSNAYYSYSLGRCTDCDVINCKKCIGPGSCETCLDSFILTTWDQSTQTCKVGGSIGIWSINGGY